MRTRNMPSNCSLLFAVCHSIEACVYPRFKLSRQALYQVFANTRLRKGFYGSAFLRGPPGARTRPVQGPYKAHTGPIVNL